MRLSAHMVASLTKEVNPRLVKRPLKTDGRLADGRLANRGLTYLVKEATGAHMNFVYYLQSCLLCWLLGKYCWLFAFALVIYGCYLV